MNCLCIILLCVASTEIVSPNTIEQKKITPSRRILSGNDAINTRPYMVYLRPASTAEVQNANWLCGGVIIHEQYVLTSAACIEDVQHFYVVSGTHRWTPLSENNACIINGAKKAVWKCVPKNYHYDGREFDNIRWMINDVAVVKVEDSFNFKKRVRGCDFIPQKILYNNQTIDLERPNTVASIAGWGSVDRFGDVIARASVNSPELLETDVVLMSKTKCKNQWPERYHYVIDDSMVCAKDGVDTDTMSTICIEQDVRCKELEYSEEEPTRRLIMEPETLQVHMAAHAYVKDGRRTKQFSGGFCENDHGGPLIVGHGPSSVVIGVISACLTANITQHCYGPFLYTSVWKNRHLISCAIYKDRGVTCRRLLRNSNTHLSETVFNWGNHPDGPAKTNILRNRPEAYIKHTQTNNTSRTPKMNRSKFFLI